MVNELIKKITDTCASDILNALDHRHKNRIFYRVKLSEIKIQESFKDHPPKKKKLNEKMDYYKTTGHFESYIVLNRDFVLLDGYTTYIIAEMEGLKYVDVMFC